MTKTEVLQEIRRMRFEEAYGGWQERRLTQEEAAQLPGVCERTFRRYVDRYEDEGLDGLMDKRLVQVSARRAPVDEVVRTEALYRERYEGWNVKRFYRRRHAGERSYTWVACPRRLVQLECWCIAGFPAKLVGWRSVAEPGGQLGMTIASGAGGRYPRLPCGRIALYN